MSVMEEDQIRARIAELEERQSQYSWEGSDREQRAKIALRAQIKGLKYALREDYSIMGGGT